MARAEDPVRRRHRQVGAVRNQGHGGSMSFEARKNSLSLQSEVGEGKDQMEVSGTPHAVRVFYDHPERESC